MLNAGPGLLTGPLVGVLSSGCPPLKWVQQVAQMSSLAGPPPPPAPGSHQRRSRPPCGIYFTGELPWSQQGVTTFPEGQKINLTSRKKIIRTGNREERTRLSRRAGSFPFSFLWPELPSTRNLRLLILSLHGGPMIPHLLRVLMPQRRFQRHEGMPTVLAPNERETEGRRGKESGFGLGQGQKAGSHACVASCLILLVICFFFVFEKKKPTKKFSKSAAVFFLSYYSSLLPSPSPSHHLSLHAHSFIPSLSTTVVCFCVTW